METDPKNINENESTSSGNEQQTTSDLAEGKALVSVAKETRPIWEIVKEISDSIPLEEWEELPSDGSVNHDHYLYGAPKRY